MPRFEFTNVSVEQFKGMTDASFDLYNKTDIIGRNGAGKTTVGIAMNLPFTGKDLTGRKNPEIHPDGMAESEPHITVSGMIDNKPITVELIQKDLRTKKQRETDAPVKIANKYKVNGVDKTEKALKGELMDRGIDLDLYERLTNVERFITLKEADKRKEVFETVSDITDLDVANKIKDEVPYLVEKLSDYKLEEIEQTAKSLKRTASERAKSLPEQIIGAERSKVDVSGLDAFKDRKKVVEQEIKDKRTELNVTPVMSMEVIETNIKALRQKQQLLVSEANHKSHMDVQDAQVKVDEIDQRLNSMKFSTENRIERSRRRQNDIDYMSEQIQKMLAEYNALKAEQFPDGQTKCPTCGQKLPADKIDIRKKDWLNAKNARLAEMKENGNKLALRNKEVMKEIEADAEETAKSKAEIERLKQEFSEAVNTLEAARKVPMYTVDDIPECKKINEEISALEKKKDEINQAEFERVQMMTELDALISELKNIERELAKEDFNARINENISAMRAEQVKVAQNLADAESILYQVGLLNQKRNEMMTESVNARFPSFLKFKLFDTLKNGEVRDCCIPLIQNEFGEWKELGKSANQALEMRAKLAILEGFQNFYDMHLPIIVDGASEIDTENKERINLNTQVIFLSVVDGADLTVKRI